MGLMQAATTSIAGIQQPMHSPSIPTKPLFDPFTPPLVSVLFAHRPSLYSWLAIRLNYEDCLSLTAEKTAVIGWRQRRYTRTLKPCLRKTSTAIAATFGIVTQPRPNERYIRMMMHFASRSEQQDLLCLIVLSDGQSLSGRLIDQAHHYYILFRHSHAKLLV